MKNGKYAKEVRYRLKDNYARFYLRYIEPVKKMIDEGHFSFKSIKKAVPSKKQEGCQIDLLVQSRRTIYVVEAKRKNEVGREIIEEVDRKVRCLKRRDNVSIKTALVYEGHLSPVVEADGYFDAIVPFSKVLGLS